MWTHPRFQEFTVLLVHSMQMHVLLKGALVQKQFSDSKGRHCVFSALKLACSSHQTCSMPRQGGPSLAKQPGQLACIHA